MKSLDILPQDNQESEKGKIIQYFKDLSEDEKLEKDKLLEEDKKKIKSLSDEELIEIYNHYNDIIMRLENLPDFDDDPDLYISEPGTADPYNRCLTIEVADLTRKLMHERNLPYKKRLTIFEQGTKHLYK
ncbi:MAG: hypothetical protein C0412_07455 [Flavobacterium sp.]|nr:hypothetical protein [Flavobacterium sp.]